MFRILSPLRPTASKLSSISRLASTLIISEPTSSSTLPAGTLSAITAAKQIPNNDTIDILLFTSNPSLDKVPSCINTIYTVQDKHPLAENVCNAITSVNQAYDYVMSCNSKFGSNVLPRISSLYENTSPVTDVIDIINEDTFVRPMYAGNAICKVSNKDDIKCLSIRTTAFDKCNDEAKEPSITPLDVTSSDLIEYVESNESSSDGERAELTSADIVISGGRGMKNGDNFKLLNDLASKLGSNVAIGASRAAVDAGFVPNDLQVGQTGKVVAPNLYIAVGISGAIQHLSGMKDSKVIVAVNSDKEAPIFQVADYGLVDDLFKVVPELTDKI